MSEAKHTLKQYNTIFDHCFHIFYQKTKDYGTSWRLLRPVSLIDQIFIKAWRIRQIQEVGEHKIDEGIDVEFEAIVNYSIMGLMQIYNEIDPQKEMGIEEVKALYITERERVTNLMLQKNHDYGEAWRMMSQSSFVDLILTKIERMKQIIANDGKTLVSEGLEGNFHDIINYAIFALILLDEESAS